MYLSRRGLGLSSDQWIQLSAQRAVLVQQLQAAQQAVAVCIANSPNMDFCSDGNVTNAPMILQSQIAAIDAQLAEGITPSPSQATAPVSAPNPFAAPVSAPNPFAAPTVNAPGLTPGGAGMPNSPMDVDVQSVTGDMRTPGATGGPGMEQPKGNGLLLALLAAGAVVLGS